MYPFYRTSSESFISPFLWPHRHTDTQTPGTHGPSLRDKPKRPLRRREQRASESIVTSMTEIENIYNDVWTKPSHSPSVRRPLKIIQVFNTARVNTVLIHNVQTNEVQNLDRHPFIDFRTSCSSCPYCTRGPCERFCAKVMFSWGRRCSQGQEVLAHPLYTSWLITDNNNNNYNKRIFPQDNPSVQSTVINGVLLTKN